ncbi:hypothetical protein TYRP_015362 [Tyrophagus putrescentiae]|nr:hypothetical protein TYRP_015362 [Tyrophagus putrescentiae]
MRDFYAAAQKDGGKLIKSGDKSNKSSLGLNNSRNYSEDGGGEVGASVSFVVFSKSKSVLPGSAASSQQGHLEGKKSKKVLPPTSATTSASKASSSSGVPPASPGGGGGGKVSSLNGGKGGGGGGKKSKAAKTSGKVFAGKSKLGAGKK